MYSIQYLQAPGLASLSWRGDTLIDWVGGGARYHLDGTKEGAAVSYSYPFDAAVDCAPYTVLYQRRGTKGLLLKDGQILRELSRSFYHAAHYDHPVALGRTRSGRVLLAHCPDEYCRLELEDCETGRRLTTSEARAPSDFFHSDLAFSPGAGRLLDTGWLWHPWGAVQTFEVAQALEAPATLDRGSGLPGDHHGESEELSAAWVDADHLLLGVGSDYEVPTPEANLGMPSTGVGLFDLRQGQRLAAIALAHVPGPLMPAGPGRVLTFFQHPRLYDLSTGQRLAEWPELPTGAPSCCYGVNAPDPWILALDPAHRRFALPRGDELVVVTLDDVT
ncbi:MAG: hypothetical protein IPG45_31575 [Deltaproteobacteria bacterium]|nr:hypothetical protein [Deltaproteobacteria bacterium]